MNLESTLHVIVVIQSALFSLVLLSRIKDRPGNKYLGALLLTVAINFAYNFLLTNELAPNKLIALSASYGFLYGPLAYLYVLSSLSKEFLFRRTTLLHFCPFLVVVSMALMGLPMMPLVVMLLMLSMATYVVLGLSFLHRYQSVAQHVHSADRTSEIRWLKFFFYSMATIIVLNFVQVMFYPQIQVGSLTFNTELLIYLNIWALVNIVTVQGLRNPNLFTKIGSEEMALEKQGKSKSRSGQYGDDLLAQTLQRLDDYMTEHKPYTDPDLTVNKLADMIEVHPKALSQAINIQRGNNFAEYINSNRIQFVEERLKHPLEPGETIVEVMYDAGFNSRSVFNTLFKKKTGFTPSQYKKNLG